MALFQYVCEHCEWLYEEERPIGTDHPEECPDCGVAYGDVFRQYYEGKNVGAWAYGNVTTFGQQSELNEKKLGKEQLQLMEEADAKRLSDYTGPLPPTIDREALNNRPKEKGSIPWWRSGKVKGLERSEKPIKIDSIKDTKKYIQTGEK